MSEPWVLLFMLRLNGGYYICYDAHGYKIAGGPYVDRPAYLAGLATLRGQYSKEGYLYR
jgi:hypothetical protein